MLFIRFANAIRVRWLRIYKKISKQQLKILMQLNALDTKIL